MRIDLKALGARIREQRNVLALTQSELAEKAGLETRYLSDLERGKRTMSLKALDSIAGVLQVRPGYLLDGEPTLEEDPVLLELRQQLANLSNKERQNVLKAVRLLKDK